MKILNLYAGIGGNRKFWGNEHEITAVELNPEIAKIYSDFFPNDKMIVTDAHEYLLEHFKEFDFIWSSPPCPSHSRFRFMSTKCETGNPSMDRDIVYANMKLYQEIILLQNYFTGLYVIENVISYYKPLIKPQEAGRHYFWSNFIIQDLKTSPLNIKYGKVKDYGKEYGLDISKYSLKHRKDQIMRNCVNPELGLRILNCANGIYQHTKDVNQQEIFK